MTLALQPTAELAATWRLLSLGFAPPREEGVAELEALAEALLETGSPTGLEDVLAIVRSTTLDTLRAQYQWLFGGSVRVSPYEGGYEPDPIRQGRQMSDVAAFYRAFGADAHGPVAERPDHVGCELEFLAFAELRRAAAAEQADEPGATLVEEITDEFLRDHAGRWLPTFFAEVLAAADRAPAYAALAALGARVVDAELERRRITPGPLARRGPRSAIEQDAFECAAALPTARRRAQR